MQALDALLAASKAPRKLVATDTVFSMDGDIAPLPEIAGPVRAPRRLAAAGRCHGFGVLGEHGQGALAHFGIASPRRHLHGDAGQGGGVFGAFVAGRRK